MSTKKTTIIAIIITILTTALFLPLGIIVAIASIAIIAGTLCGKDNRKKK